MTAAMEDTGADIGLNGYTAATLVELSSPYNNQRQIHPFIYNRIKSALRKPETGGILGADSSGAVVEFYFDNSGITEENLYIPDITTLNRVISEWFQNGVYFAGFVHAHPKENPRLSWADVDYAQRIKKICHMKSVLMMLYIPETDDFYEYIV